jgi:GAF domain-containing protein
MPEKKQIEADRERLALSLEKSGRDIDLPAIEQLKYRHFRRRQDGAAEIFRLFSQIEELEKELATCKRTATPGLLSALLMESFFREEKIKEIMSEPAQTGKA